MKNLKYSIQEHVSTPCLTIGNKINSGSMCWLSDIYHKAIIAPESWHVLELPRPKC